MPDPLPHPACAHATLTPGDRCPGCGKLQTYLAAKGLLGKGPAPAAPPEPTPVERAWLDHPVLALFRHRRRLAFFRQLHALLKAGLGLPVVFADLTRSAGSPAERLALERMRAEIDRGASFADAARFDPAHFDVATLDLFAAAETSGALAPMLQRHIERLEDAQRLRWRLVLASLYPMYLLGGLAVAGPLLDLSSAVGPDGSTAGLAAAYVAGLVRNLLLMAAVVAAVMAFPLAVAALGMESRWEAFKRGLPLIGSVIRGIASARFSEAFAEATRAGLDARRTLALSASASGSAVVKQALPQAQAVLERGGTFADSVAALQVLDGVALGQFATAERVGELDQVMTALAKEQKDASVRQLGILIAVALVMTVGGAIILVVSKIFGTLFGSVSTYYKAIGDVK